MDSRMKRCDLGFRKNEGWRHFVDSDISWTLFFKMGDISWTILVKLFSARLG